MEGWENGNPIPRNSYRNSYRSSHKRNVQTSDTIILNVGGIKYFTTRTTLTGYPETMLAKMFDPANVAMLKPTYPGGNEYFIDRNGYAFYYIMEFYRNGQILWSNRNACSCKSSKVFVSEQDLQQEIEYFQIPYFTRQIDLALKHGAKLVDEFGDSLEALLVEAISIVVNRIEINFCQGGQNTRLSPSINKHDDYQGICGKFKTSGYGILESFSAMLKKRIKTQFPSCHWETKNHEAYSRQNIKLILSGFIDINGVMSHVKSGRD